MERLARVVFRLLQGSGERTTIIKAGVTDSVPLAEGSSSYPALHANSTIRSGLQEGVWNLATPKEVVFA